MATKQKGKNRKSKLSPRMEDFLDKVVQEVEEAGIDDEYAEEESEAKPSARVAHPTSYARRTHR